MKFIWFTADFFFAFILIKKIFFSVNEHIYKTETDSKI